VKIEYRFNPPIYSALYIFTACRYLSPSVYKITFMYGVNYPRPAPIAGERGKNTVAGLRVK